MPEPVVSANSGVNHVSSAVPLSPGSLETSAKNLLDFEQKLDINLLDTVIECLYHGEVQQQKAAQEILTTLKVCITASSSMFAAMSAGLVHMSSNSASRSVSGMGPPCIKITYRGIHFRVTCVESSFGSCLGTRRYIITGDLSSMIRNLYTWRSPSPTLIVSRYYFSHGILFVLMKTVVQIFNI